MRRTCRNRREIGQFNRSNDLSGDVRPKSACRQELITPWCNPGAEQVCIHAYFVRRIRIDFRRFFRLCRCCCTHKLKSNKFQVSYVQGHAIVPSIDLRSGQSPADKYWPVHPVTSALAALVAGLVTGTVWNRYAGDCIAAVMIPGIALAWRGSIRLLRTSTVRTVVLCAAVGFAVGCIRHERACRRLASNDVRQWVSNDRPRLLSLKGLLIAREDRPPLLPQDRPTSQLVVRARSIGGQGGWRDCSGDVLVETLTTSVETVEVGRSVQLFGWFEPIPEALNPGERSPRAFWNARGVVAQADLRSRGEIQPDSVASDSPWRIWREKVRRWARGQIRAAVPSDRSGLVDSIVLGIRDNLTPADREAFRDTSTIHLLAISGLHLQAVSLFVLFLARRTGMNPRFAACCVVIMSCFYAFVVTGGASVLRSTVMAVALAASAVRQRPGGFLHRILLAGAIVLSANPGDLFDAGSQLSFLGTVALIGASRFAASDASARDLDAIDPISRIGLILDPPRRREAGNAPRNRTVRLVRTILSLTVLSIRWLATALFVSCVVWAVTAPLVAFHFGAVNPVAVLANLPLVPATSLALISGLIGLILAPLQCVWLSAMPLAFCGTLMSYSVDLLSWSLRHGSGPWTFGANGTFATLGFYVLAWVFFCTPFPDRLPERTSRYAWSFPPLFFCALTLVSNAWNRRPPDFLEVEMLAVDHGLAVLVRWPDGQNWLYDCGRMGRPSIGRNVVAPALRVRGVDRLHAVFISHADADHYNGMTSMIDAGIRVDSLISSQRFFTSRQPDTQSLIESLRLRKVKFRSAASGEMLRHDRFGSARILLPDAGPTHSNGSDNADSLVIELAANGIRLLLTGDLEGAGLQRFVDRFSGELDAGRFDILTAPHHGGLSSNPAWFYAAVRPRLVLSSQARHRFGVTTGLQAHLDEYSPHAALYTTATDGAIRLRWSAEGVNVTAFAAGAPSFRLAAAGPSAKRGGSGPPEMVLNP